MRMQLIALDDIYNGTRRPLERILEITQSGLVTRGVDVPSLTLSSTAFVHSS